MRFEELGSNVLMFVGDDHESVATALLDGDDVLLVDSLGSVEDACWLRRVLCADMGKTVRVVRLNDPARDRAKPFVIRSIKR